MHLIVALVAALAAQSSAAGAIVGLIGTATHASQELDLRLTEAQAAGSRTWAELRPAFEELLARHFEVARTLRTAWGLMNPAPGQAEARNPIGFYMAAASAHRALNDRMNGILDLYADELGPEAAEYRQKLHDALSMAVLPRR